VAPVETMKESSNVVQAPPPDVDWLKIAAVGAWILYGVEKMRKVFRLWKITDKVYTPEGLVHNSQVMGALTHLISGQDLMAEQFGVLTLRVEQLERSTGAGEPCEPAPAM
jgi:hypothetical protein